MTRLRRCLFPLLLLITAVPLIATPAPQAPARDAVVGTSPAPTGTGRISGQIVAADTGAAIRHARIMLSGIATPSTAATAQPAAPSDVARGRGAAPASRVQLELEGDRNGRFEFTDLPAGRYVITPSVQAGYVQNMRLNDPIELKDGEARTVTFRLERTGVIVGRIIDEYGDPVVRASVRAARRSPYGGPAMTSNGGQTDDLGQFRLFDLRPGVYEVSATAPISYSSGGVQNLGPRAGYVPTYYPGVASPAQAQAITVKAAQESHAMFALSRGTLGCVRGSAFDATGAMAMGRGGIGANVSLYPRNQEPGAFGGGRSGGIQADGTFTICDVPPGDYYLVASIFRPVEPGSSSSIAGNESGFTPITVSGDEVRADVRANAGATISGRVVIEGASPPTPRPAGQPLASVNVRPATNNGYGPMFSTGRQGPVRDDGSFEFTGVRGQILLSASGASGATIKAILRGADDITTTPLDLIGTERIDDVTVVLTRDTGRLEGMVTTRTGEPAPDATVLIFSDDPKRETYASPFTRTGRSLSQAQAAMVSAMPSAAPGNPAATATPRVAGMYSMAMLVPGRYQVVAFETDNEAIPTPDAAFLERLSRLATSVTIAAGETAKLDVTLSKIPVGGTM